MNSAETRKFSTLFTSAFHSYDNSIKFLKLNRISTTLILKSEFNFTNPSVSYFTYGKPLFSAQVDRIKC